MAESLGIGFVDVLPRSDKFVSSLTSQMSSAFKGVSTKVESIAKSFGAVGIAAVGAGVLAVKGISAAVQTTQEWASEVRSLQRVTGLAAEDASRLAAAGTTLGIPISKLNIAFGLLSKNIVNGSTNFDKYNIATTDATGATLPFLDILGNITDVFATLPEGPEQAAFAMNVFGRSGKDLIPVLQRGRAGLQELYDAAQKAGLVLGQDTLDASKNLTIAQRELGEAFKGAAVQIGAVFIPLITPVVQGFTKMVDSAIALGQAIGHTLAPFLAQVGEAFQRLMTALQPLMPALSELGKLLGGAGLALVIVPLIGLLKALVVIFDLVTSAVNVVVAAINEFIGALNVVIDASNRFLGTHFEHIGALEQLTTATGGATAATTDYTGALGPATEATHTMSKAQTALKSAVASAGDGILSLSTTVKDTFNVSKREMEKGFSQMLAVALRFKADMKILGNLKLGLDENDRQKFLTFLSNEGPGAIDRFVNLNAGQQRKFVAQWQQSFNAIAAGKKQLEQPVTMHADTAVARSQVQAFINATEAQRITIQADVKFNAQQPRAMGGPIFGFAAGGSTDTVPAMLTPGEFVIRKAAADQIGLPALQRLNAGGSVPAVISKPQKIDGAMRIYDWRTGLASLDAELSWEDTVRTR